jgi:hypothetical protein
MKNRAAVLIGLVLIPCAWAEDKPAPIPVVKNWEELQKQPAIDLGNGVKIRLGLEADKIPQWSGGLLYCLVENYTPEPSGDDYWLGPVQAKITFEKEVEMRLTEKLLKVPTDSRKGSYLYVRALPIDRVGTYYAKVTDHDGKVLAEATVKGTNDSFHPWMPWLEYEGAVTPWQNGIALPQRSDVLPVKFLDPDKPEKGNLPTFFPDDCKPALNIKLEGKNIIIHAETNFTTTQLEHQFLARWWVNGKPFVPKQTDQSLLCKYGGRVEADKEAHVKFDFRPERLGAKPGDKVSLQLMYSDNDWIWFSHEHISRTVEGQLRKKFRNYGESIRVSNRIEFEVPK